MNRKPILVLDFDGVIHSYASGWKGASVIPDPPVPGALEFIVTALDKYAVHILSSRSHQWGGRRAMKRWLRNHLVSLGNEKEHNFFHDIIAVNSCMEPWHIEAQTQADRIIKQIKWPLFKPPAVMTIDDRSMTFNGVFPTLDAIASFKPWNKRSV